MVNSDDEAVPPAHFGLMSAVSNGYKYYVGYLKKGGTSGISSIFGSANELLSAGPIRQNGFDITQISPVTEEEVGRRILFLAEVLDIDCRGFLGMFRVEAQTGKFGEAMVRVSRTGITDKAFRSALKQLICMNIYLMALNQGEFRALPDWFQSFIGACTDMIDLLHFGPKTEEILQPYALASEADKIANASVSIAQTLHLDSLQDIAVAPIKDFFLSYAAQRNERLQMALTKSVADLFEELEAIS